MKWWQSNKLKKLWWCRSNWVDKKFDEAQKTVRLVNYMDVYKNNKINNWFDFQETTAKDAQIEKCDLLQNDILFTPSSETPDDIWHSAVITEDLDNAVYSYHVERFRFFEPKNWNTNFLWYIFRQWYVYNYFSCRATGITRYTLWKRDFDNLEIAYPEDIEEQKRIAYVLDKTDEAIKSTKKTIEKAQRLKKSLMQNLLTGKMKHDGTLRKDEEFYIDPKFGKVPKGWKIVKWKDLFSIYSWYAPSVLNFSQYNELLYMKVDDYNNSNNIFEINDTELYLEQSNNQNIAFCPKWSIVIAKRWEAIRKNRVRILNKDAVLDTNLMWLILKDWNSSDFYREYIEFCKLERFMETSWIPQLNNKDIYPKKFIKPNIDEQKYIFNIINSVVNKIKIEKQKLNNLQRLKKSLMQHLLTGKIRIPENTFDLTK